MTPLRVIAPLEWPKEASLKIHHRGTEITEEGIFSLAGRRTAREKSLRLRRKLFSLSPTVDMKPPGY
jgi:hypothetical protein